mmetsp:Transcript_62591/g.141202  ORF Transcript_62591/g.141202 Transcript_62591/m.141202 type:complete len:148 (+) Transcript_62591:71-514(+)
MGEPTEVHVADVVVCAACCCCIESLYYKMPQCCGAKVQGLVLCTQADATCCKCLNPNNNPDKKCCVLFEGGGYCVRPSTCCMGQSQCFCSDTRFALPPNDKVPCVCTLCPCLVLFADCGFKPGCMKRLGELVPRLEELKGPGQMEMK